MNSKICISCQQKSLATKKLNQRNLEHLGANCSTVNYGKGEIIFKQNTPSSNIIYIQEGLVKIHINGPDREQIIKIEKGPTYLGIPTTFGDKINHYSATTLSPSKVCFINIDTFKDIIAKDPDFSFEIIVNLCQEELQHYAQCVNRVQKQSMGRMAEAILNFSDNIFEKDSFTLPLTRVELGDLTGCSRESTSRILANFNTEGLVSIKGKEMKILNKKMLLEISSNA